MQDVLVLALFPMDTFPLYPHLKHCCCPRLLPITLLLKSLVGIACAQEHPKLPPALTMPLSPP